MTIDKRAIKGVTELSPSQAVATAPVDRLVFTFTCIKTVFL